MSKQSHPASYLALALSILSIGYSSIISFHLGKGFKQDVLAEVLKVTSQTKIEMFPELLREIDARCTCSETSSYSSSLSSSSSYSSSDNMEDGTTIASNDLELEEFLSASHFYERQPDKRNLESSDMKCDGTLFRLDIETDEWPVENDWLITNEDTNSVVMNVSYGQNDFLKRITHEECLEPGPYIFELIDWGGDAIACRDSKPCYNITLNNEILIPGSLFSDYVSHTFDSSPSATCVVGDLFLLQVQQEDQLNDDEINSNNIAWQLYQNDAVSSFDKVVFLQPTTAQNDKSIFTNEYFACLVPGLYTFEMISHTNATYHILIEDEIIVQETTLHQNDFVTHGFAVLLEGGAYERQCHMNPPLIPINRISNFQYDERVEKVMNVVRSISSPNALNEFESSQYKAACWLLHDDLEQKQSDDQFMLQRYLIAVFLYASKLNAEIMIPSDVCDSFGVTCNDQGHVISINFSNQKFLGTLPSEISHLSFLEKLNLGGNQFEGTIPTELGNLHALNELWLSLTNSFTGTIPTEIGKLSNLQCLALTQNKLQGPIPSEIGNLFKLKWIFLSDNKLEDSIPEELYECTQLEILFLSFNYLTGTISTRIGQLQKLSQLKLGVNLLRGSIPSEIGELSFVFNFDISYNHLTGSLPTGIGNMEGIGNIILSNNLLTGSLPSELGNLEKLELLYLDQNKISSILPTVLGEMTTLRELRLSSNELSGRITDSFWDALLSSKMTYLQLENNILSGTTTDTFCSKALFEFRVDNLSWFSNSNISCPCCGNMPESYVWDTDATTVFGTIRPPCPADNIHSFSALKLFGMTDLTANATYNYDENTIIEIQKNLCLSPSGCYEYIYGFDENSDGLIVSTQFNISYNAESMSLVRDQNQCDSVMICGTSIGNDHPKRSILNHITQLAIPDLSVIEDPTSPYYEAICWILTQDDKRDMYDINDGSLLQRFIMALFYISHKEVFEFDDISSQDTCEWPGVKCDSRNKYLQEINLSEKELQGSIITEIGLLQSLHKLDLSANNLTGSLVKEIQYLHNIEELNFTNNQLVGTMHPSIFKNFPNLETLDISFNMLAGEIPREIFIPPKLKHINLSHNLFVGTLPNNFPTSQSIEVLSFSSNLLQGTVPEVIFKCKNLIHVDMSSNGFSGTIPPTLGDLSKIEMIRFNKNKMSGSIPARIFDATNIQELKLQSNRFTGSVPTQVGKLTNASIISLNHNFLKGTIPTEFTNLNNMLHLHLHSNQFTGVAPPMNFKEFKRNTFITDCGFPSFLLSTIVTCESCTMCCNSDGLCQDTHPFQIPVEVTATITGLIPLIALAIIAFVVTKMKICANCDDGWDLDGMYSDDSVYCFALSTNKIAWAIYTTTLGVQIWLFATYLVASKNLHSNSDFKYVFRCPDNDLNCSETSTISKSAWVLFFIVICLYLARDFAMSFRQILASTKSFNLHLLISGFGILTVTTIALMTSIIYNLVLAEKNTDLLTNAVILLFINGLDEQILALLLVVVPDWTSCILDEIEAGMAIDNTSQRALLVDHRNNVKRFNTSTSSMKQQAEPITDQNDVKRFTTCHLSEDVLEANLLSYFEDQEMETVTLKSRVEEASDDGDDDDNDDANRSSKVNQQNQNSKPIANFDVFQCTTYHLPNISEDPPCNDKSQRKALKKHSSFKDPPCKDKFQRKALRKHSSFSRPQISKT